MLSDTEAMAQSGQKGEERMNEEAYYAQSLHLTRRSYTFSNIQNPIPPVHHSYKPTEPQSRGHHRPLPTLQDQDTGTAFYISHL